MTEIANNNADSFTKYNRSVRGEAAKTIHDLRPILDRDPIIRPEDRHAVLHGSSTRRAEEGRPGSMENIDYSYGLAAKRLRNMLGMPDSTPKSSNTRVKTVLFDDDDEGHRRAGSRSPSQVEHRPRPADDAQRGSPSAEELLTLLRNQSAQMQSLQSQNALLKSELDKVKWRMLEIIEENSALHSELKRSVVEDIARSGPIHQVAPVHSTPSFIPLGFPHGNSQSTRSLTRYDHEKWRTELERLNSLHEAKTSRLEAQLQYTKEECTRHERQTTELSGKLRSLETALQLGAADGNVTGPFGGMCIQCAQNDALLPAPAHLSNQRLIDSLTRDRDELATQVALLKVRLDEMTAREEDAYQQVKASIELAEQAQLDLSQAVIEREQTREELDNMRRRFEDHVDQMQKTIVEERELARCEGQCARDQLDVRVKALQEQVVEVQCALEKTNRDKLALVAELDVARSQLCNVDVDYSKATDNMKIGLAQASVERNLAIQQVTRLRQEIDQHDRDRHAERLRLKSELEDIKRRLHQAEKEVLKAKDDCIQLHNTNQALENQLHQTRLAKESIERSYSDNVDAAERRAELREAELGAVINSLHAKHERSTGELQEIIRKHESLIQKLRDECCHLVNELEQVSTKYKADNTRLRTQNEQLRTRSDRLTHQCHELNNRLTQQNQLQEKMRDRLHQLDGSVQENSQQKLDLLAKESLLLRDRQQLAREIEFLQRQLLRPQAPPSRTAPPGDSEANGDGDGDMPNGEENKQQL